MATPKIALTAPQTIPLDKLALHDRNVRQIKAGVSIESLAADIARRGLLQSLSVRPVLNEAGEETGHYGVQAGGRRLRALELLVKQKKLAKNAPVPCIVRTEGYVEADSLAENTEREALHPLDQFRAFSALREKGEGEETIAAAFGVTAAVVKQRLKLANASPLLLKAFEDDEITLDELMAFCLADDHNRQEEVWAALKTHWNKGPNEIRRMLTEKTVRADDRRALFIGAEAYKAVGGIIIRDLFEEDDGGYLQDPALLNRLVEEKLQAEADKLRAEGWKWAECSIDFPWNHKRDYVVIKPATPALDDKEQEELEALAEEHEALSACEDELAPEDQERLNIVIARLDELEGGAAEYDPKMKRKAGVFVSLRDDGRLIIDRGYIHPGDIKKKAVASDGVAPGMQVDEEFDPETGEMGVSVPGASEPEAAAEDTGPAIPDRLKTELTAYRTLALREALANNADVAFLAVLHALVLKLFYPYGGECGSLQIQANDGLVSAFPGLNDFEPARKIEARHKAWAEAMPKSPEQAWDWLGSLDRDNREALFAHCAGLTVNGFYEPHTRCAGRMGHADQLASTLSLDMRQAGWTTGAGNYLGRITKAAILDAVREAKGDETAGLIEHLKKKEMAAEAERLMQGTGWLPELLRTSVPLEEAPDAALPAFLDDAGPEQAAA
ncbi:MAG: ParB N-terminal domain-containing protein [Rhodomicrobium sp.]